MEIKIEKLCYCHLKTVKSIGMVTHRGAGDRGAVNYLIKALDLEFWLHVGRSEYDLFPAMHTITDFWIPLSPNEAEILSSLFLDPLDPSKPPLKSLTSVNITKKKKLVLLDHQSEFLQERYRTPFHEKLAELSEKDSNKEKILVCDVYNHYKIFENRNDLIFVFWNPIKKSRTDLYKLYFKPFFKNMEAFESFFSQFTKDGAFLVVDPFKKKLYWHEPGSVFDNLTKKFIQTPPNRNCSHLSAFFHGLYCSTQSNSRTETFQDDILEDLFFSF